MAVTPRGIVTPNASDDYDLIVDLAAMANSTDAAIDTAIGTVATASTDASNLTSGTVNAARIPNLQDLNGTLDVASGGTGATTVAAAQDNLGVGLAYIVAPTILLTPPGGAATANTLGKITFSSVSSISLNNVFSSSYTNYVIQLTDFVSTSGIGLYMRFRTGSVDETGATYSTSMIRVPATGTLTYLQATAATNMLINDVGSAPMSTAVLNVMSPAVSTSPTVMTVQANGRVSGVEQSYSGVNKFDNTKAVNGFTLFPSAAFTFSGTIQVFGYNS